jgi:hypothetical protein
MSYQSIPRESTRLVAQKLLVAATLALCVVVGACADTPPPPPPQPASAAATQGLLEAFPDARVATLRARDEAVARARPQRGGAPMFVLALSKRWVPGAKLTVAFRGGSEALHGQIVQVAALWTLYANVGLDFGYVPGRGYRTWDPSNTAYAADIRIGFDEAGYFSCVGNDSVAAACAVPQQSSMNYFGFDRSLPADWQSTVLHEFGHAFGIEHEHQNPEGGCDKEFRWDDDAGYVPTKDGYGQFITDPQGKRPGIYTVLGGPPNKWEKAKVDFNLRQLPKSTAFHTSKLDNLSIMKYEFEEWMYVHGRNSPCFSERNLDLSPLDREGIALLYPRQPAEVAAAIRQREEAMVGLRDAAGLSPQLKSAMQNKIDALRTIK